jgi:esterase/lipase
MPRQIAPQFLPSGHNTEFPFSQLTFSEAIQQMQAMVAKYHVHQPQFNQAAIVEANSPFDWPQEKAKRAVILVHGLSGSAFQLRDIGRFFQQQGFWVRAITLPGHGTVPGDLLKVKLNAWQQALEHAVKDLARQVSDIYVCGYSLGGALAVDLALRLPSIKGLVLFTPAIKLKRYIEVGVRAQALLQHIWQRAQWLERLPELDYAKYASLPVNSVFQLQLLIDSLAESLAARTLAVPVFTVLTAADENVDNAAILGLQQSFVHPMSQALLYASEPIALKQANVIVRTSHFPQQNILDFSHIALATSPMCPHYGVEGDYEPLSECKGDPSSVELYRGSFNRRPKGYRLQRLTYNPDFAAMTELLAEWLAKLN